MISSVKLRQLVLAFILISLVSSLSLRANHEAEAIIVQSNLAAPNWVYGSLTEKDFKKSIFDLMTQNSNVLKCMTNFPFFNGQKCINCDGQTPYFNLSTKKC